MLVILDSYKQLQFLTIKDIGNKMGQYSQIRVKLKRLCIVIHLKCFALRSLQIIIILFNVVDLMNVKKTLIIGAIIGFIVGVLFIFVQPLFGMSPLTDRHAAAYIKLGDISPSMAIVIAWSAHLLVSIAYGLATATALLISRNLPVFALLIVALGWFTTVIAGPANQLIVRAVTSKSFPSLENLPALNFNLDPKLALHLIFFLVIGLFLLGYSRFSKVERSSQAG